MYPPGHALDLQQLEVAARRHFRNTQDARGGVETDLALAADHLRQALATLLGQYQLAPAGRVAHPVAFTSFRQKILRSRHVLRAAEYG